ncbi:hypothetical protein [Nocardiopsis algeriensis]|uniref:Uncharacterized protein n=1 Tax=Nocardiopsis algeriensis TaxID=1478215 RepID=A0A841IQ48_9ACTN|nr:hypothetical protein [Nocardiopsis algeriensis]MBB6118378.1 hypothetical protein [Nocardiopsis algeriensis]
MDENTVSTTPRPWSPEIPAADVEAYLLRIRRPATGTLGFFSNHPGRSVSLEDAGQELQRSPEEIREDIARANRHAEARGYAPVYQETPEGYTIEPETAGILFASLEKLDEEGLP